MNSKAAHQQKINWLLKHQSLWEGISQNPSDWRVSPLWCERLEMLAIMGREEGLYSHKTYYKDIMHSLFNLIQLARQQRRNHATS